MCIKTNPSEERRIRAGVIVLLVLWLGVLFPVNSAGQAKGDVDPELQGGKQNVAPVKVDGQVLFYVRGISSFPAGERAATISKRIKKSAKNPSISTDSLKIIADTNRLQIYAGEEFIMNVYKADAQMEGINQAVLADLFLQKTSAAIDSYRHERSRPVLVKHSLHALGAAALMAIILFVLIWLIRRISIALEKRIKSRIDKVEDKSFRLVRSHQLWKMFHILFKTLKIIVIVVLIAGTLQYILGLFPWTKNVATYTIGLFLNPLVAIGKGFINFLPSLAFLIIIYLVTRYLLKLIKLLFAGIHEGGIKIQKFDPDWAMPTYRILRVFVIVFAVVIAYPYIPGSNTSAFKGISVFLGVLLSLGSSSFISNIIAGYSMTYRGAFKKGDRIEVNEHIGTVEEQKLLVTRLRSIKNEEIVIPNSIMLNSHIVNFSKRAKDLGLILHTTVGIGYETSWRQVDAMLMEAASRTEGLLKQPSPFVLKRSLGDFAVNYEINAYCDDASKMLFYYNILHQNILDVFNENNVQIMTPAYETDPETPKVVPKDQWHIPLASKGKNKSKNQ